MKKKFIVTVLLVSMLIFTPYIVSSGMAQTSGVALPPCSQAVHDRYQAVGADGILYPTWHPQIDMYYPCYFDHEHGSNPAFFIPGFGPLHPTNWPLFGYTAAHYGMSEPHAGFKVYVFDAQGVRWMITQHMGTANAVGVACNQFHTFDIQARDTVSDTMLSDVHVLADYGQSRDNITNLPLTPATCLDNPQRDGNGIRQLPVNLHDSAYEPWRVAQGANVFGLDLKHLTINTTNPQTGCETVSCEVNYQRTDLGAPARGTDRFLTLYSGFGFNGVQSGEFYVGGIRQYIAPGWTFSLISTVECRAFGIDYFYQCGTGAYIRPLYDSMQYRKNLFIDGGN